MDWPIKEKNITNLFLDQQNIRTPLSDADQNALIRDMFTNEDAFELVKSYLLNGIFPDEFPIVIDENSRFIVIEGNRRLAALKAIIEPDIVPSWKKRIIHLISTSKFNFEKIRVVIAPNRDAAIKHIANKHTINYRKPWKPLREAYFFKSQIDNGKSLQELIDEYPEHDVVRFIKMLEMHHLAKSIDIENELLPKIHDERKFPITTLERFYNDKNVADFLGIEYNSFGQVIGKIIKKEFEKGYKKIIKDVAVGIIDSRKFNTSKERKSYLRKIPKEFIPDKSKKGSFKSRDFKEVKPPKEIKIDKQKNKIKEFPKGLFRKNDIPFNLASTSLKLVYDELCKIDVSNFPNATFDLLRSFLECTLVYYLKETNEYKNVKKDEKHNPKLSELLTYISSEKCISIKDEQIKEVARHIKSDWSENYSLARLNMINHNENWNSTEKDVRSAWGKIESLFKILLNPEIDDE